VRRLSVLIVDDHAMVRAGLASLLAGLPGIHVAGEAADGGEAVSKAATLTPGLVLMDVSMPVMNGPAATSVLVAADPRRKVLAVSAREDPSYVKAMLDSGASGYVFKRSAAHELLAAISAVAAGKLYLDSAIDAGAIDPALAAGTAPIRPPRPSSRERSVLQLIALGFSCKEIADQLQVSAKTIETYKKRVTGKLGLRSRVDVVRYAIAQGWLGPLD